MNKILACLFVGLCICFSVSGEVFNGPTDLSLKIYDALSINGPAKLRLVKASTLEVKGPLEFHKLAVAGKADITGTVSGDHGKFGQLTVIGPMNADHVICEELSTQGTVTSHYLVVKNLATIVGPLSAQNSTFKDLKVTADEVTLNEVTVDTVTIGKSEGPQKLILQGKTTVNGDISFESGAGRVKVEGPDVVINGAVNGAKVDKRF